LAEGPQSLEIAREICPIRRHQRWIHVKMEECELYPKTLEERNPRLHLCHAEIRIWLDISDHNVEELALKGLNEVGSLSCTLLHGEIAILPTNGKLATDERLVHGDETYRSAVRLSVLNRIFGHVDKCVARTIFGFNCACFDPDVDSPRFQLGKCVDVYELLQSGRAAEPSGTRYGRRIYLDDIELKAFNFAPSDTPLVGRSKEILKIH